MLQGEWLRHHVADDVGEVLRAFAPAGEAVIRRIGIPASCSVVSWASAMPSMIGIFCVDHEETVRFQAFLVVTGLCSDCRLQ